MDAVKRCKNRRELKTQLNYLPKGLDEAYAQIFEQSRCPDDLQKLLQWLVFAERPLTVTELAEVLAVDFTTVPFYDPDLRCKKPTIIWGICNGLVTELKGALILLNTITGRY